MGVWGGALTLIIGVGVWLGVPTESGRTVEPAPPAVVASIAPVHSLVAAVMTGIGEPTLLVRGAGSPHTASLRPSEAAELQRADVVFWIGQDLETFLAKPLAALPIGAEVVALAAAPGMTLLPARAGGAWSEHHHGLAHDDEGHDRAHGDHADEDHGAASLGERKAADMHVWLDPENAKAMATAAATALARADPARAATYAANAEALRQRLDALDGELRDQLAPVLGKPYIVFHDAYQYFEARYGLSPGGAITFSPERAPGARTLSEIRERIKASGALCVFREPQFEPNLVTTVAAGTSVRVAVLDPIGADITPGPDAYPALLMRLAASLRDCLAGC